MIHPNPALPEVVTLDEAKLWVRYDQDHLDTEFRLLIAAATEAVFAHVEPSLYLGHIPARMKLAVLTHVANAFANKEDGADLPASAGRLLNPMRTLDI